MNLILHLITLGVYLWLVALFFYLITQKEIENEISLLKVSKATGPHSISTDVIQILKTVISKPLEIIFNLSLGNGCVPSPFKLASVNPIHKPGTHRQLGNYRPYLSCLISLRFWKS